MSMNEKEFSETVVLSFFKEQWEKAREELPKKLNGMKIKEYQNILIDFTVVPVRGSSEDKNNDYQLVLGLSQQDIVFYVKTLPSSPLRKAGICLTQLGEKEGSPGEKQDVIIPLVICELKTGFNSKELFRSSCEAQRIKSIFPDCAYYFCVHTKENPETGKERNVSLVTLYRQGKGIDGIFLGWEEKKQKLWESIKEHLKKVGNECET